MSKTGTSSEPSTGALVFVFLLLGTLAFSTAAVVIIKTMELMDSEQNWFSVGASNEPGRWSCSILNSNSFGECLGNLAQELDITAAPALDTNDACQYAQSRSANTLWIKDTGSSTPWGDALERAEYQAQLASEGNYIEVSPAKEVLDSIGVVHNSYFWGPQTVEADLQELEKNDEARKALSDYISILEVNTPVTQFYIEDSGDSGTLQLVNISDRTNITLGSEGFKEDLIETHNLTPVHCPTSD